MRPAFQPLLVLFCCLHIFLGRAQSETGREALRKLKEASYYDSARFFGQVSEVQKLAQKEGALVPELYLYKGNYFFYVLKLAEAKQCFEKALAEASRNNNRIIENLAKIRFAYIELELGSPEKAQKDMESLLLETKKENQHTNTAEILNFLGLYAERSNDIQKAVKYYLEGIDLSEQHGLNYFNGVFRNNLGLIKYASGQSEEALKDYETGLKYALLDNNARLASHIKVNVCMVNVSLKRFEVAAKLFPEVTEYSRKNNLPIELASVYINLGTSFQSVAQPQTALAYIDSAIQVLQAHGIKNELERAYLGKCDVLIASKKTQEAADVLRKMKELNDVSHNLENSVTYYLMQYRLATLRNKKDEALTNYLIYTNLRDSLNNLVSAKAIEELQVKYDVQRKEVALEKERTKSLELEKSNQRERFLKWFIAATGTGMLALVILFSIAWSTIKLRNKQEQFSQMLIRDIEAERARIARDLHDDVGQSLSIIKSKVMQGDAVSEELSRVIEQTRQISHGLYPSSLEKIGLVRGLAALMEKVQTSTRIECNFEIDEQVEAIGIEKKTHIYRILQECVNNTIKHSGANALKVSIEKQGESFLLNYRDNGKGMDAGKVRNGLGLLSISERVKMIGGTMSWGEKNEKGFVLNIKFDAA